MKFFLEGRIRIQLFLRRSGSGSGSASVGSKHFSKVYKEYYLTLKPKQLKVVSLVSFSLLLLFSNLATILQSRGE